MYGIIHKALKDMVIRDFGDDQWQKIITASGIKEDVFVSMQTYDDDYTYKLINTASAQLGASVDDCLELFGKYWILDAAPGSYSNILDATGQNIITFINNINSLHDRITSAFPNYVPPEFYIEHYQDNIHKIHYISTRAGLSSFVVGLLLGLGERFKCTLEILGKEQQEVASGEHWIYNIRIVD